MSTVRDHLWLWGHSPGSHNPGTGSIEWNLPAASHITPSDAARYLDIKNLLMIRYNGHPTMPNDILADDLSSLDRAAWGITGAMGESSTEDRRHVRELARRTPNITELVMDDFINWDTGQPELTVEQLREIESRRHLPDRTLDLMTILYSHQLDAPIDEHLPLCNQVSLWVRDSADLSHLPAALDRLQRRAPRDEIYLGCYLWDLGPRAPMPLDRLQRQCEQGLEWLVTGRIQGIVALASCYCDLQIDTVTWLRQWVREVADIPVQRPSATEAPFAQRRRLHERS